jgi:hypothetical protein
MIEKREAITAVLASTILCCLWFCIGWWGAEYRIHREAIEHGCGYEAQYLGGWKSDISNAIFGRNWYGFEWNDSEEYKARARFKRENQSKVDALRKEADELDMNR